MYFTYGMHYCMNIATEKKGIGAAVLIRALEPIDGVALMRKNRGEHHSLRNLMNGPAKCAQAFGITRRENGVDLLGNEIFLCDADSIDESLIGCSARIGITQSVDLQWRFFIKGNPFVSKQKVGIDR